MIFDNIQIGSPLPLLGRVVGTLLLVAVAASLLVAVTPPVLIHATSLPPAGCHEQRPAEPRPWPASHLCCQAGHQAAIPQARPVLIHSVVAIILRPEFQEPAAGFGSGPGFASNAVSPGSPPHASPLRI